MDDSLFIAGGLSGGTNPIDPEDGLEDLPESVPEAWAEDGAAFLFMLPGEPEARAALQHPAPSPFALGEPEARAALQHPAPVVSGFPETLPAGRPPQGATPSAGGETEPPAGGVVEYLKNGILPGDALPRALAETGGENAGEETPVAKNGGFLASLAGAAVGGLIGLAPAIVENVPIIGGEDETQPLGGSFEHPEFGHSFNGVDISSDPLEVRLASKIAQAVAESLERRGQPEPGRSPEGAGADGFGGMLDRAENLGRGDEAPTGPSRTEITVNNYPDGREFVTWRDYQ